MTLALTNLSHASGRLDDPDSLSATIEFAPKKLDSISLTSPAQNSNFDGIRTGTDLISATFHSIRGDRFTAQFDSVTARFGTLDLDIDSDNDAGFAPPSGIAWEEELEDHAYGIGNWFIHRPRIIFTPVVFNPYPDIFDPLMTISYVLISARMANQA